MAVVSLQTLFVFPARNGIFQRSLWIVGKKVTDIRVVFKLLSYGRFRGFLFFENAIIRIDCFAVSLSRTVKSVNFAVLSPMSAARDKFKCYALDLSLLAVTERRTQADS